MEHLRFQKSKWFTYHCTQVVSDKPKAFWFQSPGFHYGFLLSLRTSSHFTKLCWFCLLNISLVCLPPFNQLPQSWFWLHRCSELILCSLENYWHLPWSAMPAITTHTLVVASEVSKLHNPQSAKWTFIAFSPQWYLLPEMRRMPSFNLCDHVVTGGIKEFCLHPRSHTKTALSLLPEGLASWISNTHSKEKATCLLLSIPHLFSYLLSYLIRILLFPLIKHKWKPYQPCKCPVMGQVGRMKDT